MGAKGRPDEERPRALSSPWAEAGSQFPLALTLVSGAWEGKAFLLRTAGVEPCVRCSNREVSGLPCSSWFLQALLGGQSVLIPSTYVSLLSLWGTAGPRLCPAPDTASLCAQQPLAWRPSLGSISSGRHQVLERGRGAPAAWGCPQARLDAAPLQGRPPRPWLRGAAPAHSSRAAFPAAGWAREVPVAGAPAPHPLPAIPASRSTWRLPYNLPLLGPSFWVHPCCWLGS